MKESRMKVKLLFIDELVGTRPPKGWDTLTGPPREPGALSLVFPRDGNNVPGLFDYTIKGFFKDAFERLEACPPFKYPQKKEQREARRLFNERLGVLDNSVFVRPRFLPLTLPPGSNLGIHEHTLCRTCCGGDTLRHIIRSEKAPVGTSIAFEILTIDFGFTYNVASWLNYGWVHGIGQWRNAGLGRFDWEEIENLKEVLQPA